MSAATNRGSFHDGANSSMLSKKVVVVGNSGVGKTALVLRYVQDHFNGDLPATIGGSFLAKKIIVDNTPINLQIWDTAGQERFRSMVRIYYRGAAAAVLVFDMTDRQTFNKLKDWVLELHNVLGDTIVIAIACNKMDLAARREVSLEEASEYGRSIGAEVFETSAKLSTGVDVLFKHVAQQLLATVPADQRGLLDDAGISISRRSSSTEKTKCPC